MVLQHGCSVMPVLRPFSLKQGPIGRKTDPKLTRTLPIRGLEEYFCTQEVVV